MKFWKKLYSCKISTLGDLGWKNDYVVSLLPLPIPSGLLRNLMDELYVSQFKSSPIYLLKHSSPPRFTTNPTCRFDARFDVNSDWYKLIFFSVQRKILNED